MKQEDKELLLKDLSERLPYGVKILHTGWDCDGDTDFDTVETLIGIDDSFIYTVWDKTGDREKHCLSVFNWKPYLRSMSSMTDEENAIFDNILNKDRGFEEDEDGWIRCDSIHTKWGICPDGCAKLLDYLNSIHIDYRGLIEKGLAIEVTEENNPYKE